MKTGTHTQVPVPMTNDSPCASALCASPFAATKTLLIIQKFVAETMLLPNKYAKYCQK